MNASQPLLRRRPNRWGCLILLALLGGCSQPPPAPDASPPPPSAPSQGELLLAKAPDGWVETAAMSTPGLRMAEYGPAQEPDGELERVTFEAQPGAPLPDPIEFVLSVSRDLAARCNGYQDFNISSGLENGYPTSVRLLICGAFRDSPEGQVVMAKAIQGNDQFYVITRRRLIAPSAGDEPPLSAQSMAEWSLYLKSIGLCDTRSDDHRCPDTIANPGLQL